MRFAEDEMENGKGLRPASLIWLISKAAPGGLDELNREFPEQQELLKRSATLDSTPTQVLPSARWPNELKVLILGARATRS